MRRAGHREPSYRPPAGPSSLVPLSLVAVFLGHLPMSLWKCPCAVLVPCPCSPVPCSCGSKCPCPFVFGPVAVPLSLSLGMSTPTREARYQHVGAQFSQAPLIFMPLSLTCIARSADDSCLLMRVLTFRLCTLAIVVQRCSCRMFQGPGPTGPEPRRSAESRESGSGSQERSAARSRSSARSPPKTRSPLRRRPTARSAASSPISAIASKPGRC